jgi:hypothetical protein
MMLKLKLAAKNRCFSHATPLNANIFWIFFWFPDTSQNRRQFFTFFVVIVVVVVAEIFMINLKKNAIKLKMQNQHWFEPWKNIFVSNIYLAVIKIFGFHHIFNNASISTTSTIEVEGSLHAPY